MCTLAREEPFSATVESSLLGNVCHGCFKYSHEGVGLKRCSRCSTVFYCSVKCQRQDWSDHSVECKCMLNYAPRVPNGFVRLLARILFRVSKEETIVAFNSRSYDDLQSNCEHLIKSEKHTEHFSSLYNLLQSYTHGIKIPSKAEVFSAYGKLTISYVDIMGTTAERNKIFKDQFCFSCSCTRCTNKVEDSWKMSVNTSCCTGGFFLVDPSSDWESEPPLCFLCKKVVPLKSTEVLDHIAEAKEEINQAARAQFNSTQEQFEHWLAVHKKFSKILSPYNTALTTVIQNLLLAAESIGREDVLQEFTGAALIAYRRWLKFTWEHGLSALSTESVSKLLRVIGIFFAYWRDEALLLDSWQ
ncbi:unnamed protein product [Nippostrongylus brasiliensis]|uniref:MYND-type domain-containing protein n=1 Tax=Nippostrongylus brasiliensis TaxID=27835 RepID=A0A158QZA7_NIPBR|nr:unnamed protein product [Nippostrongylus brasiliensis]